MERFAPEPAEMYSAKGSETPSAVDLVERSLSDSGRHSPAIAPRAAPATPLIVNLASVLGWPLPAAPWADSRLSLDSRSGLDSDRS
jgi:hypothetical protein